jgi:hypothetical protein
LTKPISIFRINEGPPALRLVFEHHQYLRHISTDEWRRVMRTEKSDEPYGFWRFDLYVDSLAGWCTQLMHGSIRPEEIGALLAVPELHKDGPFGPWLAAIEAQFPRFYCYMVSIELMRLAVLSELERIAPGVNQGERM